MYGYVEYNVISNPTINFQNFNSICSIILYYKVKKKSYDVNQI